MYVLSLPFFQNCTTHNGLHTDRPPLWLDPFHHLRWFHEEQPPTLAHQVRPAYFNSRFDTTNPPTQAHQPSGLDTVLQHSCTRRSIIDHVDAVEVKTRVDSLRGMSTLHFLVLHQPHLLALSGRSRIKTTRT